jgi:NADPH-dependent glutamate synthase beta subunit-like oxidoreductase/NAD(P)H-flavin reductase
MLELREKTSLTDRAKEEPPTDLPLGIEGFTFADLYLPVRLEALSKVFMEHLAGTDPSLGEEFDAYQQRGGKAYSGPSESALLLKLAVHLSAFLARLFRIEAEREQQIASTVIQAPIFDFKKNFLQRRVIKKFTVEETFAWDLTQLGNVVDILRRRTFPHLAKLDVELATAHLAILLMNLEKDYSALNKGTTVIESSRQKVRHLRAELQTMEPFRNFHRQESDPLSEQEEQEFLQNLLGLVERWAFSRFHLSADEVKGWTSFRLPQALDYQHLVTVSRPLCDRPELLTGPPEHLRQRDGFKLTDQRFSRRAVLDEAHYCIYCHEREKDSCSKGLKERDASPRRNVLGIPLDGCPLEEKISEMHRLKRDGDSIAALAMVVIDNPLCAGTGHRICNDCMKSCIFQKQDPVNIPQAETGVLTDVLELPYGFEIYSLLTRWNPLNVRRPHALPYNGKDVLIAGMGPAGYTLAHFLLNEGFGVAGIDGLKIEPLPDDLTGNEQRPPKAIRNVAQLQTDLDQRILAGFGGVSEYGITVRWDKNFLTMIHLLLLRREKFRVYGGVRFGGTLTIDDAWGLGFDHIAIATGAGKPTIIPMRNNLIRGIRKASDFLMALQLTGAFKRESLANLQVELPALVIGGGLTAIDTATEMMAYYVVQVEKILERFKVLVRQLSEDAFWQHFDADEQVRLKTWLEHALAVRTERERAHDQQRLPDFVPLLKAWGGVSIVYRRSLVDSPAYRLNHEEVIKSLEEGIAFIEQLSPVAAIPDAAGAVCGVEFERTYQDSNGRWRNSTERVTLPARTVCVAAGTSPNITYEREHPGTFKLAPKGDFFAGFRIVKGEGGQLSLIEAAPGENAFFTSYSKDNRFITYYGDNHPVYAGNVVKAMASAKRGYLEVVSLFEPEVRTLDLCDQPDREEAFRQLTARLDDALRPRVVRVDRLTPTIVEVIVRAPFAADRFHPGQFYRLQNYETLSAMTGGTRLSMEGLALTGAWVDKDDGLLSMIVLEMGCSSRLCALLKPGEPVVVMGPTGSPTEIPRGETILLAGGGLGNAVLFSIGKAMRANGNRVLYFAGYKKGEDLYKQEDVEKSADQVIWSTDAGSFIQPRRTQDRHFRGNIVQAIKTYATGGLQTALFDLMQVDRVLAIGSDRMMAAVKAARRPDGILGQYFRLGHLAIGSINSPMQCMMKEVCAQCLQVHVDPVTCETTRAVFSCFNQDQPLDEVDFANLRERLLANSVQEKLSGLWLDYLLRQ